MKNFMNPLVRQLKYGVYNDFGANKEDITRLTYVLFL